MPAVGKRVVLKLDGDLEQHGFQVSLEIAPEGDRPLLEMTGALPPNPELVSLLTEWQQAYRSVGTPNRIMPQEIVYRGSINWLEECRRLSHRLRDRFNHWLESSSFRPIDQSLREHLSLHEPIRVLIRTQDDNLRRLPWHLWNLIEHYTQAEIALSALTSRRFEASHAPSPGKVRILAILGHCHGIDIDADRAVLEHLPDANVTFLVEPSRKVLNQQLWEQSWDILFFAGHSQTEAQKGRIYLNPQESLTLEELNYGLRRAIAPREPVANARRLQLAIFNSCDGLGLAQELEQLHLPQLIVMREPVPDPVAQAFLKHFLVAFVQGESLYLAARQAREKLQGLEGEFPCASWLPIICQNAIDLPPNWQDLTGRSAPAMPPVATTPKTSTLAAIIFTDVESFTAKVAADEKRTLNLVRRDFQVMQKLCQEFEGQVLKSLGDGLLMYFVSAERAVSCAVEIQTRLATAAGSSPPEDILKHRIGIHLGDVEFVDGDVLGSGVNIAARLQKEAPAGGICLSRTVYEVVKSRLTLPVTDGGFRSLKGLPESLKVYQISPPTVLSVQAEPVVGKTSPYPGTNAKSLRRRSLPLQLQKQGRWLLLTSWLITSAVMGIRLLGWLQPLELLAFDHLMRLKPGEAADDRLLLITLDESDLDYQNQQKMQRQGSLSDQALEQLLAKLEPHQPVAIGLDIYRDQGFFQGNASGSSNLAKFSASLHSLVAVCVIEQGQQAPPIKPPPELPPDQLGFANLPLDPDNIIRRQTIGMSMEPACNTDKSLSYQLVRRYLDHRRIPAKLVDGTLRLGDRPFPKLQPHTGGYHQPFLGGYEVLLNYRNIPQIAQQVTLSEILNGSMDAKLSTLVRDRIVLIGTIARSFNDYRQTPNGEKSGVEIHAQMVSQLLSAVLDGRPMIWCLPQWGDALWIWLWAVVGGILALRITLRFWLAGAGFLVIACLYGSCFLLLLRGGWLPLIPACLALVGTGTSIAVIQHRSSSISSR